MTSSGSVVGERCWCFGGCWYLSTKLCLTPDTVIFRNEHERNWLQPTVRRYDLTQETEENYAKIHHNSWISGADVNPGPANCKVNHNFQLNELEPDPYDISN